MARTSRMNETAQSPVPDEASSDAADAAAHLAVSAHLIGTGDPELASFFTGFTRYASPEDLIHYTGAELAALVKLVFERASRKLVGAHCIGDKATELVHIGMSIIQLGGTVDAIINMVFNYPTLSECYKYAAYDALGSFAKATKPAEIPQS